LAVFLPPIWPERAVISSSGIGLWQWGQRKESAFGFVMPHHEQGLLKCQEEIVSKNRRFVKMTLPTFSVVKNDLTKGGVKYTKIRGENLDIDSNRIDIHQFEREEDGKILCCRLENYFKDSDQIPEAELRKICKELDLNFITCFARKL
jgi:hypothetical protein